MARIILRLKQVLNRLVCGKTKFDEDYRYHTADDPYVPGTNIPRVKSIPLGPRINGFLGNEIDELIDALVAVGGTRSSVAAKRNAVKREQAQTAPGPLPSPQPAIKPADALIDGLAVAPSHAKPSTTRRQAQSKQTPHVAQRR